jgi:alpha-D-ribose 1-methylphosphonate 5-triphosphate synthase subunit PhnL
VEPITDLSFRLKEREFGVITGPSGAGKTTVLKCIYRSYLPTNGAINYRLANGSWVDLATCPERDVLEVRKWEIALVTQFFRCAPRVPTEEVVASPRVAQGVEREAAVEESRTLLRRFKIPEKLWRAYPVTFSGGEQQRINLARAIVQKPRLLLLDEPTASLDERSVHAFLQALEDVRRRATTCLAIFHDQKLINHLATQVVSWPLKNLD